MTTFEWIIITILILLVVGCFIVWLKLNNSGMISGCLGKKGVWSKHGKTLVENILIQTGNNQKAKISQKCIDCVIKKSSEEYSPEEFIIDFISQDKKILSLLNSCCAN